MRLVVENLYTTIIVGGTDYLVERDFIKELYEFMEVNVPGAYFSEKYKTWICECLDCGNKFNLKEQPIDCYKCKSYRVVRLRRLWDGKISFLKRKSKFLTGFLPSVLEMIGSDYDVEIEDNRNNVINGDFELIYDIGKYKLTGKYSYQLDAVESVIYNQLNNIPFIRGVVDAATNAGKNSIMTSIYLSLQKPRTLILVHRLELFNQTYEFFKDCGIDIGRLNDKFDEFDKNIVVAMVKILHNRLSKFDYLSNIREFQMCFVDESHRAAAETYTYIFERLDVYSMLFFSGTPYDVEVTEKMKVIGYSGDRLVKITNEFLIQNKISLKPLVTFIKYQNNNDDILDYNEIVNESIYNQDKLRILKNLILERLDKQVLIVVTLVGHGEYLFNELVKLPILVEFVHGSDKDRTLKLENFKKSRSNVLITSMILKEGVNIESIGTLINISGGKSVITVKQLTGRTLRLDGINETVEVIEFYDRGKYLTEHSHKRLRIYLKEKFEVSIIE